MMSTRHLGAFTKRVGTFGNLGGLIKAAYIILTGAMCNFIWKNGVNVTDPGGLSLD